MTHDSALDPGDPSTELRRQRDEFLAELDALRREAERVHAELVLPLWNDPVYHGLPQTLYGYMMATFSVTVQVGVGRCGVVSRITWFCRESCIRGGIGCQRGAAEL